MRPPLRIVKDENHFVAVNLSVREMSSLALVADTLFDILYRNRLGIPITVADDVTNALEKFKSAMKAATKETP